jgi:PAS domain S-box-containing protein
MSSLLSRLEIRYGAALAAVGGAWLLRWLLDPRLGDHHPFSFFLIAVLFVAWYLGTGPAVLAFTLGAVAGNLAFVAPRNVFSVPGGEQLGFFIFIAVGAAGILASRAMRGAEHRAETHRRQAAVRDEALRESEERFRRLAQSMPQIVWTAAPDGTITFINERWQEYTGLTLEKTNHLDHVRRVFHPEDAPRVIDRFRASLKTGDPHEAQWRFRRRSDGVYRWFLTRAVPVRDEGGRIREWFGTATDIDDQKRTEAELRHSEERLRLALDAGQMQPWEWAPAAGTDSWDVTGVEPFRSVHSEDAPLVREAVRKALETGEFAAEFRVRGPEGRNRWLEGKGGVVRDPSGRPSSLMGVVFDVTERREAEEALRHSERLYRAIGESIEYGIWVCDAKGRNVYASESFLRLVGLTQRECSEFGWGKALDPDEAEATIAAWKECVRGGTSWEREHRFRGVDGDWHHVLARGVPIRDDSGAVVCWAGINLDIGALKRAQQELKESDRRKDEFLAILAHELRNPLAPLCNGLELLQLCRGDEGKVEEVQTMMGRQLSHLVRLVDDLLDVSRISRGKFELRTELVTLDAVIRNALDTIRPTASRHGHHLTVSLPEEPLYLRADAVRLAQVFSNLLDNACKYTEKPGRVTIEARREGPLVTVSVMDTGLGIPPESLDTVFDLFTQVDRSRERVGGGLGIGLSLVRGLVERHGGTVEARSDGPGRGSTFLVRLPLARPERTSPVLAGEQGAPASQSGKVLVVDDNRDSARSLAMILQAHGHDVRTAFDGASAIEAARTFMPSFILLDIGMPGVNGYDAARRIREEPFGRDVVLIAMTGWGQAEDRRRSELAGFDAHLTKPVDVSSLNSLLVGPPVQRGKRPGRGGIKTPAAG